MLKRTQTCGELTRDDVGQEVVLNGWVDTRRDHGGLIFIDLRDRYGLTQVVFEPGTGRRRRRPVARPRTSATSTSSASGGSSPRLAGKENPKLKTGAIEVRAAELEVFNAAPTPPFEIHGAEANEELRLKYRYLDLRRPGDAGSLHPPPQDDAVDAQHHVRPRLPRGRDAHPGPEHPRRRPRLPRPQPGPPRALLRPAAVAAAVQAGPDGRRVRPLLPDRPLLPRRGPPVQPPARVHPARRRDVVRRGRGRHRHDGESRRRHGQEFTGET